MNAAIKRARQRIKNLVSDFHGRLAHDLTSRYNVILIPTFDVSKMVIKNNRKINFKTARNMLNWSQYKFKQKLLQKAEENPNCEVHVVTEEYTSKACGICGRLNHKLGGNKTFNCAHCGFKFDGDMNAARNIMIKNLESSRYKLVTLRACRLLPAKAAESVLLGLSG
jgi:putative transposase